MKTINQNLDTPQTEESKQNLSKSNSELFTQDDTLKVKSPRKAKKQSEEFVISALTGKKFNKQRYNQFKTALGVSGTLVMPLGMVNDGSDGYSYFWASTQYDGQIEKKKALGYEVCTEKNKKEYRHFASQVGSDKHEHVLMRITLKDKDLISEIQRERKAFREMVQVTENLDQETVFENKTRLAKDGEFTLSESLLNKYNNNKIKQV